MTRPDDDPPPWAGAPGFHSDDDGPAAEAADEQAGPRPGFQRYADNLPPHAPMPGSPPYPAPPPIQLAPVDQTGFPITLGAAAVWLVVNLVLALVSYGSVGSFVGVLALVAVAGVSALITWFIARHRTMAFWQLVLIAAPTYWVIRLLLFPRQIG